MKNLILVQLTLFCLSAHSADMSLDSMLSTYSQVIETVSSRGVLLFNNNMGKILPYKFIGLSDVSDCELNLYLYRASRNRLPATYPDRIGFCAKLVRSESELVTQYAEMRLCYPKRMHFDPPSAGESTICSADEILSAYDRVRQSICSGWIHSTPEQDPFEDSFFARSGLDPRLALMRQAEKRMCLFVKKDSLLGVCSSIKKDIKLEHAILNLLISKLKLSDYSRVKIAKSGVLHLWICEDHVLNFGRKINLDVLKKACKRLCH